MSTRTVRRVDLEPVVGSRFQPTGFPDLGAATYERAGDPGELLLVESVQSMANHLEATTWDFASQAPAAAVADLPYVRVVSATGAYLTSSRVEAHRLAAAWLLDGAIDGTEFRLILRERLGLEVGLPLDTYAVARAVFALDPLSLLHGVFFAQQAWPWQPKIARAVTCFIEAHDAKPAVSGGVKRDSVINTTKDGEEIKRTAKEGYGMVPHHRTEYTAAGITLFHVIDEQQLRRYGLSDTGTELLSALASWEISTLLADGLRLRTACDLVAVYPSQIPDAAAADTRLQAAIAASRNAGELAPVTEVVTEVKQPKVKTKA